MSNGEVLKKTETRDRLILNIRKRLLNFLVHLPRKDNRENLIQSGKIDGKTDREKQYITYMVSFS